MFFSCGARASALGGHGRAARRPLPNQGRPASGGRRARAGRRARSAAAGASAAARATAGAAVSAAPAAAAGGAAAVAAAARARRPGAPARSRAWLPGPALHACGPGEHCFCREALRGGREHARGKGAAHMQSLDCCRSAKAPLPTAWLCGARRRRRSASPRGGGGGGGFSAAPTIPPAMAPQAALARFAAMPPMPAPLVAGMPLAMGGPLKPGVQQRLELLYIQARARPRAAL